MTEKQQQQAQRERAECISYAAYDIRRAIELLGKAASIPRVECEGRQDLPALDVATADDSELKTARISLETILNPYPPNSAAADAEALSNLKIDAVKEFIKELREDAKRDAEQKEKAAELIHAIDTELERREAERNARKKELTLEERIEELERLIYRPQEFNEIPF